MGSSKKHKEKDRESKKKKKHRSRSRSRSKERDSRKRRHRDRSLSPRDKEQDLKSYSQSSSHHYPEDKEATGNSAHGHSYNEGEPLPKISRNSSNREPIQENIGDTVSGDGSSLSIEETNRLRAKLGLKPLDVQSSSKGEDGKPKKSEGVHQPPVNMGDMKKTERLREKVATKKAQRSIESKLQKVKGLGDSDSDEDDTSAWVQRSRKMQREKEIAEKRAKMLEEMDADFGIGDLVDQEFKKDAGKNYTSKDLRGLKVEHTLEKFTEGRNVILTLKDKGVLDEDDEGDVLINVNIEDDERAEKNIENKKQKPIYKPYDEPEYDEYGMMKPSSLLEKYDEEIEGAKKESFTLGSGGQYDAAHEKRMDEIRRQLRAQGVSLEEVKKMFVTERTEQSLQVAAPTLASEYLTKEEVEAAKFKKVKKKVRKIRKKEILKADDLLPLADDTSSQDYGSRSRGRGKVEVEEMDTKEENNTDTNEAAFHTGILKTETKPEIKAEPSDDVLGPDEDLTGVAVEEEEVQNELQMVLARARKLKIKKERGLAREVVEQAQAAEPNSAKEEKGANIVLNSTSEFCRNLGEIPTYGLAGNREEDRDELLDMELELMEQRRKQAEQDEQTGGWNAVDIDDNPVDIQGEEVAVLEEEPIASDGIGAALKLALKKGYLENENPKKNSTLSKRYEELQAQNYTIQDKRYDDLDEKNRKRERYSGGMITDFKEKPSYKPDVKLDYVDDGGRSLSQKEAFRQLSHRFHGKGSGKKKTEKRGKKVEEELLMKQMSSTDTPLNTLSLLKDKQKSEKSPYIMLSGNKGFSSNTIVKSG